MFWFIVGIIATVAGMICLVVRKRIAGDPNDRYYEPFKTTVATVVGVVLLGIGLATLVMDSFTIVPARNVGVQVTFGKAERTLSNGFHWVKPWSSIETVDATVQNINRASDTHDCPVVRLANQTTACVDVTVQWNIDQHANTNELWQRYRGTNDNVVGNVGRNVVERELRRSLNVVFETYNPLAVLSGQVPTQTTDDLASRALSEMRSHVDAGIVIDTVRISVVHYDEVTQGKLNGYAQQLADTQIATQAKLTAEQQKLANDLLAAASSKDPGVMYQNCLNLLKDLAAKGQLQNLPPTFNCSLSSTPVIVGQK
jgi:regulator of protease activity HflC (stomatin/prohibitin superfamily)